MASESKRSALQGEGFHVATIDLPDCPLCKRVRLAFIIRDDNAVPYCSVCRCSFTYVFRGKMERVGTTLFLKIYPNIPYNQIMQHIFDPQDIPQNDAEAEDIDTSLIVNQVSSHPKNMRRRIQKVQPYENPYAHKQVAQKILKYLREHNATGTTKQLRKAIGCSPQGFKDGSDKLIKEGQIERVKRGTYKLINHK